MIDIPREPIAPGSRTAFALYRDSPALRRVEELLTGNAIEYTRIPIDRYVVLSGLDSSQIHMQIGLPRQFNQSVSFVPIPESPDGFN